MKKININIPQDYKAFLIKNNGGYVNGFLCTPDFIEIDYETNKRYKQSTNPDKFYTLEEVYEEYYENMDDPVYSEKYLAIAYDSSGNNILLCVDGSENEGNHYILPHSKCVGYKVPLFLNGEDEIENLEVSDLEVYWGIMSPLINL